MPTCLRRLFIGTSTGCSLLVVSMRQKTYAGTPSWYVAEIVAKGSDSNVDFRSRHGSEYIRGPIASLAARVASWTAFQRGPVGVHHRESTLRTSARRSRCV